MRRNPFKPENVNKAREVANRFGDISIKCMMPETEANIIGAWYPNIRGELPINLKPKQRHRIAERLFNYSFGLVTEADGLDRIAANLKAFEEETDPDRMDILDHMLCRQMENLPDHHYMVKRYAVVKTTKIAMD